MDTRSHLRSLATPPMAVAVLALVVALGGTSYAAVKLAAHSVGARELKPDAVTSVAVKDRSLKAADFAAGQLPAGPRGPQGVPGKAGAPGAPGDPGQDGTSAASVITGQAQIAVVPATGFYANLSGSATSQADAASVGSLMPSTPTVLRSFSLSLSVSGANPLFEPLTVSASVNGTSTVLCTVPPLGNACSMAAADSVAVPASAVVAISFSSAFLVSTQARWGLTLGAS